MSKPQSAMKTQKHPWIVSYSLIATILMNFHLVKLDIDVNIPKHAYTCIYNSGVLNTTILLGDDKYPRPVIRISIRNMFAYIFQKLMTHLLECGNNDPWCTFLNMRMDCSCKSCSICTSPISIRCFSTPGRCPLNQQSMPGPSKCCSDAKAFVDETSRPNISKDFNLSMDGGKLQIRNSQDLFIYSFLNLSKAPISCGRCRALQACMSSISSFVSKQRDSGRAFSVTHPAIISFLRFFKFPKSFGSDSNVSKPAKFNASKHVKLQNSDGNSLRCSQ